MLSLPSSDSSSLWPFSKNLASSSPCSGVSCLPRDWWLPWLSAGDRLTPDCRLSAIFSLADDNDDDDDDASPPCSCSGHGLRFLPRPRGLSGGTVSPDDDDDDDEEDNIVEDLQKVLQKNRDKLNL